jgi:transposase-like protein
MQCNTCKEEATESRVRGLRRFDCPVCGRELRPNGDPVPPNHSAEAAKRQVLALIEEQYKEVDSD